MVVYYFGVWPGDTGHFLRTVDGRSTYSVCGLPLAYDEIDGAFCPDGQGQPQSVAKVTHISGWTLLAMWDRSGDARGNSNSAFVASGEHDFEAMLGLATEWFPHIVKRITDAAPITQAVQS